MNKKYDNQKMIELKQQGISYPKIAEQIGCSLEAVKYQLCTNSKKNQNAYYHKIVKAKPLILKRKTFIGAAKNKIPFSTKELEQKLGENPICYLTGKPIDLLKPETYSLDHIIPISKGGWSSLENLGLLDQAVNQAKYNLTPQEFIEMCRQIVSYADAHIK